LAKITTLLQSILGFLTITAACLAIPISVAATCQVRDTLNRESYKDVSEAVMDGGNSILIGLAIGESLAVVFVVVRVRMQKTKGE
jgi:hypothetical protein